MTILLTGGAGFMGSNMIHYLLRKYPTAQVINLDKLAYSANLANLSDISHLHNYTFVKGDVSDNSVIENIFSSYPIDIVINYAAETHVDRSIDNPSDFLFSQIVGTFNLLSAVQKYGTKKMIQISTDEVYGDMPEGEAHERSPFQPKNPYAASKAGADHLCMSYANTYHTPIVVTHSCNYIGPNQYPEKFIPLFITNLLEDKPVPVYGDGKQVREWIYTEDHCRAIDILMQFGEIGEVYNIGTRQRKTNIEVVRTMLSILGKSEDLISYVADRAGHDVRYAVNCDKFMKRFSWQPQFSFEESLKNTIDWYVRNESWWKNIKNSDDYRAYYDRQYNTRETVSV